MKSISGKGGRNQELALAAALRIEGLAEVVLLSLGSDGTDGPTGDLIITGSTGTNVNDVVVLLCGR